jgi:hypothetical protein
MYDKSMARQKQKKMFELRRDTVKINIIGV